MRRLILTSSDSAAGRLNRGGDRLELRDSPWALRFVWGQLPSPTEMAGWLASSPGNAHETPGSHWLDFTVPKRLQEARTVGGWD